MATPNGVFPTGTVATTVLVAVSTTETELPPLFATYRSARSGVTARLTGARPTGMVAVIVLLDVSITETVLLFALATYALACACADSAWISDAVPVLDEQALEPSAVTSSTSADS